ncbi:MAG: hypothetical protein ABSH08_06705 [Tepidisphaeraceae bacterium]|jgi:hypothetical protein
MAPSKCTRFIWRASANRVDGVVGVMYTSWRGDYSNLEAFAKLVHQ